MEREVKDTVTRRDGPNLANDGNGETLMDSEMEMRHAMAHL
jgi:hypothetical protein